MNLEANPVLYAGLLQVCRRGTAEMLEESETGIFLRDTVSGGFLLAVENVETGKQWLQKHEYLGYFLLSVFREELVTFIRERYGLKTLLPCYQAMYPGQTPPIVESDLEIRCAIPEDLPLILAHYGMLDEEELSQVIRRGNLFLGFSQGTVVGFIGEHLEGSMGLLEIFPEHRRKGYGMALEAFLIAHMLEQGLLPFCQVVVGNHTSMALQRKLGMEISEEKVYWVF